VYQTRGILDSPHSESITKAEYETYKEFGILSEEKSTGPIGIRGTYSIDYYSHFYTGNK